jgi:hypothetical protein
MPRQLAEAFALWSWRWVCFLVAMLGLTLNLWNRCHVILGKMCNTVAFRAMGCFGIRPSHAFFGHMIHLGHSIPKMVIGIHEIGKITEDKVGFGGMQ